MHIRRQPWSGKGGVGPRILVFYVFSTRARGIGRDRGQVWAPPARVVNIQGLWDILTTKYTEHTKVIH